MPGRPVGWLEVRVDPRVQGSSVVNNWALHDHLRRTVFRVCVGRGVCWSLSLLFLPLWQVGEEWEQHGGGSGNPKQYLRRKMNSCGYHGG